MRKYMYIRLAILQISHLILTACIISLGILQSTLLNTMLIISRYCCIPHITISKNLKVAYFNNVSSSHFDEYSPSLKIRLNIDLDVLYTSDVLS